MNRTPHPILEPHRRHTLAGTLLTVLLLAAWLSLAGVLGGSASRTAPSPGSVPAAGLPAASGFAPVASRSYVVQPGDTLWSVARGLQPDGDLRPLVDRLAHTAGGGLRPGQRIPLP
ncbi:MAG TPA: LysM domain-containing protein [Acidimicrobiales bacterium]|nr:LysM domain-containing protein [Acidimicrobiales bacterium]